MFLFSPTSKRFTKQKHLLWLFFPVPIKLTNKDDTSLGDDNIYILMLRKQHSNFQLNFSCPDPGRKEKIKLNFYFRTSLRWLKRFYEGL